MKKKNIFMKLIWHIFSNNGKHLCLAYDSLYQSTVFTNFK